MDQSAQIQNLENHKRILGILFIITAAFQGLILLFLNAFLTTLFSFIMDEANEHDAHVMQMVFDLVKYLPMFILVFSCLPSLIAGFGLMYKQGWAMIIALILGCLKLFSFPVGTAIGIYTIWVYSEEQKILKASQRPG